MKNVTNNVLNSIFSSLLVLFLLMTAFFFLYDLRTAGNRYDLLKSLKYEIVFKKTLTQSLGMLPVLVIFVYIFSFTVLFTLRSFQTATFAYHNIAVPSFVFLVILLMLIIASHFLFVPNLRKNIALLEYRALIARDGYQYAKAQVEKGEYRKGLVPFDVLLEIDENNKEFNDLFGQIQKNLSGISKAVKRKEQKETQPSGAEDTTGGLTSGGYYERAKAEYEKGNTDVALFYLERALVLHKDNREIRALYDRVKREAERSLGALTKQEKERQRLLKQKERGIEYLDKGRYYEAYDIFLPLSRQYPKLRDLSLYLKKAEQEILKIDFLPEEVKRFEWFPSTNNIVFLDKQGYLDTIERVISYKGTFYFFNITRYRLQGNSLNAARFKYGKWIENQIRLKNDEGFVKRAAAEQELLSIRPHVLPGYLQYSGNVEDLRGQLNVSEYLRISGELRASGLAVEEKFEYLAKSCGIFFSVYVLALLMSAFSWSRRSIHDFPPIGRLFLFFVIVPPLCYFLHYLYTAMNGIIMYTHQYASRTFLPKTNILVYMLIIHLALSAGATLYYLSQSSTME